jgi:DNA polymerase-4
MLAKMGSGLKKPNGIFEITWQNLMQVYQIATLQDVCGIGARIERRLHQMGIFTLLKLRATPLAPLIAEFGNVEGHFLYDVGQGRDVSPVKSFTQTDEVKSVGRNYCMAKNEYDKRIVLQNVYELCEEVCIKLRRLNKKARYFGIGLRGTYDIYGHTLRTMYSNQARDMFYSCLKVINRYNDLFLDGYTRQIGVWAGHLQSTDKTTLSIFPEERRFEALTTTLDKINERFGDHTIRNGFLLYANKLTTVPNGYGSDRHDRLLLSKMQQENSEKTTREAYYD